MKHKILMGASLLAILAAFPALAETNAKAEAEISTQAKIENTLDKAGDSIKEGAQKAGEAIERNTEKAAAAAEEKYGEMKAYFSDEKDVQAVSSVNIQSSITVDELVGADVEDPTGKKIGSIEDILIDKEGEAETVVINDGGVLGLGGKLVAFDYDVVEGFNRDEDVVVKLTQKSIDQAKRFEYKASEKPDPKISVMPATQFSMKKILDSKVVDAEGKAVAEVDTVALDDSEADYLIVTFNKIFGIGGDKAALNFEALDLVNNNGKYTFKLSANQTAQFESYKSETKAN